MLYMLGSDGRMVLDVEGNALIEMARMVAELERENDIDLT